MRMPKIHEISSISIMQPEYRMLDNGIPVYLLGGAQEEISFLQLSFDGGLCVIQSKAQAILLNAMMKEGTLDFSAKEIAEKIDFYGATLTAEISAENSGIELVVQEKYFAEMLPLLYSILTRNVFPQKEFSQKLELAQKNHLLQREKVSYLASVEMNRLMFGEDNPLGKPLSLLDYESVTIDNLRNLYVQIYNSQNCKIVLAGCHAESLFSLLNETLGKKSWGIPHSFEEPKIDVKQPIQSFVYKENAVQTSLYWSRTVTSFFDPERPALKILDVVFGGYFDSRLMRNIRERKGYTYGINTFLQSVCDFSRWSILTQTDVQYTSKVIREIQIEMDRLCQKKVSNAELARVKKYQYGELLRSVDGIFETAKYQMDMIRRGIDATFMEHRWEEERAVTADDVLLVAQKYLNPQMFFQVECGESQK